MINKQLSYSFRSIICNLDNQAWSELMTQFSDATIYQSWAYASVMYGKEKLIHAVIQDQKEIVAIAQIGIKYFPALGTGTANVHWGPLWKKKGSRPDIDHLEQILIALRNEFVINRGLLLRIWPNEIDNDENVVRDILKVNGYSFNPDEHPYRTLLLRVDFPIDDLRKNLDQKWRNQLNRAEKNGLNVIEGYSDDMYQVFLKLQQEMLARKNYSPGVNYQEYRKIQKVLPEAFKMKIMICEHEQEPVSTAICSAIGKTGIYLLGATGNKGMKLNGSNLLQWRMIQWLKNQGCQFYDLGGIDSQENPF